MLEDVGYAGRIPGHGEKCDQKRVVVIVSAEVQMSCPRHLVAVLGDIQAECVYVRGAKMLESRMGHGGLSGVGRGIHRACSNRLKIRPAYRL